VNRILELQLEMNSKGELTRKAAKSYPTNIDQIFIEGRVGE